MTQYLSETETMSLDFDEALLAQGNRAAYRLTLNDEHGHYDSEVYLRKEQLCDLLSALKKIEKTICKEDFL